MGTTAESRVVAAFTVVVALMIGGWQALTTMVGSLLAQVLPDGSNQVPVLVGLLVVVSVSSGAFLVAQGALATVTEAWARHLAGATRLLAMLVGVATLVQVVNVMVGDARSIYGISFLG